MNEITNTLSLLMTSLNQNNIEKTPNLDHNNKHINPTSTASKINIEKKEQLSRSRSYRESLKCEKSSRNNIQIRTGNKSLQEQTDNDENKLNHRLNKQMAELEDELEMHPEE